MFGSCVCLYRRQQLVWPCLVLPSWDQLGGFWPTWKTIKRGAPLNLNDQSVIDWKQFCLVLLLLTHWDHHHTDLRLTWTAKQFLSLSHPATSPCDWLLSSKHSGLHYTERLLPVTNCVITFNDGCSLLPGAVTFEINHYLNLKFCLCIFFSFFDFAAGIKHYI